MVFAAKAAPAPKSKKGTFGMPGTSAIAAMMHEAVRSGWLVLRNCLERSWPRLYRDEILVTRKPELTEIIIAGIWVTSPSPIERIE